MIVQLATGDLKTKYGVFQEALYYDGQKEAIAFYRGNIDSAENILCRVHSSCIFGHYFNSIECTCQQEMDVSQALIEKEGIGIIILLDQEGKGNGHYALLKSVEFKRKGIVQSAAYEAAGFQKDARDYHIAAKILNDLGVKSIRLLTNNPNKVNTLKTFGIQVKGTVQIPL
jgi:GTP cyclohydrolase II